VSRLIQVVKIGGSVLTDKCSEEPQFAWQQARRIAGEIGKLSRLPVIVHGTGSYGKPSARQYGYMNGKLSRRQADTISKVSSILESLRMKVLETFRNEGIPAVSLNAGSLFVTENGSIVDCHWEPVLNFVERGVVPIISGDFVTDRQDDFSVCSSDWIASHLSVSMRAHRLVFVTDVPGVIMPGETGKSQPQTIAADDIQQWQSAEPGVEDDVTLGMQGKLAAAFLACESGVETFMVDGTSAGSVFEALSSDSPHATRFVAKKTAREVGVQ
jgi:isopentenyl phosphate kinase